MGDGRSGGGLSPEDAAAVEAQLGRPSRGALGVAHRCGCGRPDVVATVPRLPDGTPFPTTFYLTCPRAAAAIGTLESDGVMRAMTERLAQDEELAAGHAAAHEDYLRRRTALGDVPEIAGVSAGGMPTRVKCLHVLVAHALAAGPGVTPLGDEALAMLDDWAVRGPCVDAGTGPGDAADPAAGQASPERDSR
ncbi:DUF501 domain-containing protein [Pseudokineococcus sp. 1T1Z-3]|uniref:DUF501 domain-containing protein n=1 Tax=Pseudokineococcus sp. 1T1Z-3 TaxID=3132745 RepID=UPI00403F6808